MQPSRWIQTQLCGEEIGLHRRPNKALRFLECPSATRRSSRLTKSRNKRRSLNEFPSMKMCKSGGCCSFSAQPREFRSGARTPPRQCGVISSVLSPRCPSTVGHHRATCSTRGLLGRKGFATESAIAQIFREGGAKVSTNVMVRDLDIPPPHRSDLLRQEIVAEGLTFGGAHWPFTPQWCHHSTRKADAINGQLLGEARKLKERT